MGSPPVLFYYKNHRNSNQLQVVSGLVPEIPGNIHPTLQYKFGTNAQILPSL
jgi:hypothetical protein